MEGFQPKHWFDLTKDECASALKYLMYLKEKSYGILKGQGCADGRPQRLYTTKTEASSPTTSLAGLIITCVIDAYEGRDVTTVDIPGAFLQTRMPANEKEVHVVLDGQMAELLAKISPETYQKLCPPKTRAGIHLLQAKCSTIWNIEGCTPILEEANQQSEDVGVHN